jgi:hypothetical protein
MITSVQTGHGLNALIDRLRADRTAAFPTTTALKWRVVPVDGRTKRRAGVLYSVSNGAVPGEHTCGVVSGGAGSQVPAPPV